MRRFGTYPRTAVAIMAAATLAAWPFLAGGARPAVFGGALLALVTQFAAHFLLKGWRARTDRFTAAILAGFGLRVAAVAAGATVFALARWSEPVPFLLSLGGLLIALLVAESVVEHRRIRAGAVPAGSLGA